MFSNRPVGWMTVAFPTLMVLLLSACRSTSSPVIEFTEVPAANAGGPGKMAVISGRAKGAGEGDMIVLYSKSQRWWVQPFADRPLTSVNTDGSWSTKIHLGTEYAALLVHPGFHPAAVSDTLPSRGGDILTVATTKGKPASGENASLSNDTKIVHFSGYDWEVRHIEGDRNGSPNVYRSENAFVDANGFLHLRVTGTPGDWFCSEVIQSRSLGYGTYRFNAARCLPDGARARSKPLYVG